MLLKTYRNTFLSGFLAISAFAIVSCGGSESGTTTEDTTSTTTIGPAEGSGSGSAEAVLSGTKPDTTLTGSIRFVENDGKIKMTLDITVPKKANQSVAVHIHEHGDCGNMGNDAHGHWNPTKVNHGKWGSESFHSGDIGNVTLDAEGKGTMELESDRWTINGTDSVTNILNRSIIVHNGVDDYKTQPTGNAGGRIGCGVIKKS